MNTLLLVALFVLMSFAAQMTVLWTAARVCRLERRSWWRAALVTLIRTVPITGLYALTAAADESKAGFWLLLGLVVLVDVSFTLWLLRLFFGGSIGRRSGTWAMQLVLGSLLGYGMVFLVGHWIQAFVSPHHSMSPNVRGFHTVEELPDGNHLIVGAYDAVNQRAFAPGVESSGIVAETYEFQLVVRHIGNLG
ncbi:MAG TPA: hypothetical protein VKE40_14125 [Gemmataceae bacterium]|nr:hypothetical protein [Gemmataceae bacterium]